MTRAGPPFPVFSPSIFPNPRVRISHAQVRRAYINKRLNDVTLFFETRAVTGGVYVAKVDLSVIR